MTDEFTTDVYYDDVHLNEKGARAVSRFLFEQLKRRP